ncbi:HicB family toxin-antitoxin system [Rhodococcus marinonascens]|uniref:HicB family toxin-antitoxin system n=1 Tax=Rhodococcus marinonascens TaxID=38311 RepID=UPI0009346823|nr:HicB family toxin-antitoxin system [Rhodococcus marinonascens]
MKIYAVDVTREGKWWMVSIPELDGLTQARRFSEAELMAREFIAVDTGTPIADVAVSVSVAVGAISDAGARADEIRREREQAAELEARVLAESKRLAHDLAAQQVPVRDIGELLGVTFQRASQLVNS